MKLNKLFACTIISLALGACVGGNETGNQNQAHGPVVGSIPQAHLPLVAKGAPVPDTDFNNLNSGALNSASSSSNRSSESFQVCNSEFCAYASAKDLHAVYATGPDRKLYWVMPNQLNKITITFKQTVDKNFRIKGIYNELGSDNKIAGKITQINTTDCDKLATQGNNAGKSCDIKFTYQGVSQDNTSNIIHFNFTDGTIPGLELDYNFVAKNINTFDAFGASIVDVPIINLEGELTSNKIVSALPSSGIEDDDIIFQREITDQISLKNFGYTSAIPVDNENELPTINVGLDMKSVGSVSDGVRLMNSDRLVTTCGADEIMPGDTCFYPFLVDQEDTRDQKIKSLFANIDFNYTIPSMNHQLINIHYIEPLIVSVGSFVPRNYTLTNNNMINLELKHLSSDVMRYDETVENVKFSLKYNPAFVINSGLDENNHKLIYAYGDVNREAESAVSQAVFSFDPGCFKNFELDSNYNMKAEHSCDVKVIIPFKANTVLPTFQLYAEYSSATEMQEVQQYIGNITVLPVEKKENEPAGSYKNYFDDIHFDGVWLEVRNSKNASYEKMNYVDQCASQSTVGVQIDDSYFENKYYLHCDTYSDRFPTGSFQKSCNNLSYKGGVLTALCKKADASLGDNFTDSLDSGFGGDKFVDSSLDVSNQCAQNSPIDNINGKLTCSINK